MQQVIKSQPRKVCTQKGPGLTSSPTSCQKLMGYPSLSLLTSMLLYCLGPSENIEFRILTSVTVLAFTPTHYDTSFDVVPFTSICSGHCCPGVTM